MTTFNDLVNSVYTITKRPDLVAETTLALKRAILKEHAFHDYKSDLKSINIALTQPVEQNYRYSVSLGILAINLRKIMSIREFILQMSPAINTIYSSEGIIVFEERAYDNIFTGYHGEFSNYYFKLGDSINLVAQRPINAITLVYYSRPSLTNTDTYSDWLADEFDYLLYTHAAAEIFRIIGKTDELKTYLASLGDHRSDVLKSQVTSVG